MFDEAIGPIGQYYQLTKTDSKKMPESGWKFAFYLSTWSYMAYIIMMRKGAQYFYSPSIVWQNYSIDNPVETEIYVIYMVQLSFYCHSLYSTLCVDQWRKDTPALMVHHVLCVLLISISLATKTHKSGLFAMFLHDGCDILLEGTKLSRYFKIQGGRVIKNMDAVTNAGFICFIMAWIYCRLYCYPLKQVYMASVYVTAKQIQVPFIQPIVLMLWLLLIMNIYWFTFILKLLYKVVTGQIKELDDNREYSENKNISDDLDSADKLAANGRYYLRQRKIDYNLLHTGRSQ
ncbi:ceramide synthase 1-like [Oppia nitens]|uniref:ceramide synthase 1-like n=1 Tax=Oppia nitens TaxID=1686743 RepID=UPI0023DC96FC|nr:ceramide synthase 1-like [Oppia nitens]